MDIRQVTKSDWDAKENELNQRLWTTSSLKIAALYHCDSHHFKFFAKLHSMGYLPVLTGLRAKFKDPDEKH